MSLKGERNEFDEFCISLQPQLIRFCLSRLDENPHQKLDIAKDILQQALISAWIDLKENGERQYPIPWMFRIVTNKIIDHHRKKQRERGLITALIEHSKNSNSCSIITVSGPPKSLKEFYRLMIKDPNFSKLERKFIIYRYRRYSLKQIRTILNVGYSRVDQLNKSLPQKVLSFLNSFKLKMDGIEIKTVEVQYE